MCIFQGCSSRLSLLCVLFLFRPSHSLCWGSLLSSHTQHLASGDPGKIHTGTVWGRVGMFSGSAKVEGSWCFLVLSESHREKEGEVHFSSSALVVDFTFCGCILALARGSCTDPCTDTCTENKETCVNYFPAVLQLLPHCKNVDTLREPLSSSSYSGWLVHGRKC